MKFIGLSLSFLLFFSPLLANTQSEAKSSSKTEIKVNFGFPKSTMKVISAIAKTGIGLSLIAACSYMAILAVSDSSHFKALWCTIENEYSNGKVHTMEKVNLLPAMRFGLGIACGMGIASGAFALNSAANDLQSIKTETNE